MKGRGGREARVGGEGWRVGGRMGGRGGRGPSEVANQTANIT